MFSHPFFAVLWIRNDLLRIRIQKGLFKSSGSESSYFKNVRNFKKKDESTKCCNFKGTFHCILCTVKAKRNLFTLYLFIFYSCRRFYLHCWLLRKRTLPVFPPCWLFFPRFGTFWELLGNFLCSLFRQIHRHLNVH